MKYADLLVWQKAMDLVVDVYQLCTLLPPDERFGLVRQMQRAASSIPANIAEGHGRKATRAFIHHLSIASGSLMELETHVHIAARLGYVNAEKRDVVLARTGEISRMMSGLQASLSNKLEPNAKS